MEASTMISLTLVLALLISSVSGQVTQCASDGSPQLRFVAQLSVSGCALFVHDTGANDGPHLAVEPLMCVTESLSKLRPRYDPVTQQTYVSVPVMLRDDAILAAVRLQLRHLSPKSVKFAIVSDIAVSTDASSVIQALGFLWNPVESVGFLRLGCNSSTGICWACILAARLRAGHADALDRVMLTAGIVGRGVTPLEYRLTVQNRIRNDVSIGSRTYLPTCQQLRFVRSIRLNNCTARVHQRLDMEGHFLIEPLLCHRIASMMDESVIYDYSRDMYYLKLDVVLQDDITLDTVRTQLADLSPRSVAFMRLWRAQSVVASALSRRFVIGPLMVSADWRSAQVRVYCKTDDECKSLKSVIINEPINLWQHVKWSLTSLVSNDCLVKSDTVKHMWTAHDGGGVLSHEACLGLMNITCPRELPCKYLKGSLDGRVFVIIQQRKSGSVNFGQHWASYVAGFGDASDFWIGLSTIHLLSASGVTLRVEMKLWNGTELHTEYAGFKVGDASTSYLMTYREMLSDRSSIALDIMEPSKGVMFSTEDKKNQPVNLSCFSWRNYGGWWFRRCDAFNPSGRYPDSATVGAEPMAVTVGSKQLALREVRLMLQL